jgi:hypothetical protein
MRAELLGRVLLGTVNLDLWERSPDRDWQWIPAWIPTTWPAKAGAAA